MKIKLIAILVIATNVAFSQETQIKGFVDTQYGIAKADSMKNKDSNRGFKTGQFDLFITSQINDKASFLGETVFEWDPEENQWALDVERVIIKYAVRDNFNISAGKFHTPFGYWNNAYHHGAVIQPTINRPVIVRFEDNGGYLPIHQTGFQLSGTGISSKNVNYSLFISNGQSKGNTGGSFDYNTEAISGSLSMEPIEDLTVGASAYSSKVPQNSVTYQGIKLDHNSQYTLLNGFITYFNLSSPIEFAFEYFNINNSMLVSRTTNAMYGYFGVHIKKNLTPYVLYNKVSFENGESYFLKNDIDEITVGARYRVVSKFILKLEYTSSKSELYGNSSLLQTQVAIGF